jgi:hypothetical protein
MTVAQFICHFAYSIIIVHYHSYPNIIEKSLHNQSIDVNNCLSEVTYFIIVLANT